MLAVQADRLPAAIGDLDPGNRALLDLSLRRGVSDAEIGELLRKEPADVARGRDAVLELLADALAVGGHDRRERVRQAVAALPDDAWRAGPSPPPPPPPSEPRLAEREPPAEPPAAGDRDGDPFFEPEPRRSRRGGLIAVLGIVAVLVALAVLLLSGGDDDDEPDEANRNSSQPAQDGGSSQGPQGRTEQLTALRGGKGAGRVAVTDEAATITIRGLPDPNGAYQVWLYDSVVQAQSLGTVQGGSGRLEVKLPPDARRYRFLDVSREPADANPNHSGDSVLRAPLRKLLR
jgi:hypothetical protein